MRTAFIFLFFVESAWAQLSENDRKAAYRFVMDQYDSQTGAFRLSPGKPHGLRPTLGALRAIKHLGFEKPDLNLSAKFVRSCYDPMTGGFREPDSTANSITTSIGIMAASECGLTIKEFPRVLEFLRHETSAFEDARIGAAALEAINERPNWVTDWIAIANLQLNRDGTSGTGDGLARDTASAIGMKLRLGELELINRNGVIKALQNGQRADGGWGKKDQKHSDLDSSYRVMRTLVLLDEQPGNTKALSEFLGKCRNTDGGYGVEPGQPSSMSGVYYAASIHHWLSR